MSLNISPPIKTTQHREKTPCLLQYANNSRNHGRFNDVTIRSGDISISANRMVLSCYCSYFDQLFSSQTTDQITKSDVDVPEVDGNSLKLIIQFIYTGQISIDSDNVLNILSTAHHLEMDDVKQFCFKFLEDCITPDNCITILITAKEYRNFTLRDKVYQHISDNYLSVTKTPAFASLDNLELFLIVYHLKTRYYISDEVLCRSLLSWTKHDEEKRTEPLHRIIKFVNVDKLSYKAVKDFLNESLIQEATELFDKLNTRMEALKTKETKILAIGGNYTKTSMKIVYSLCETTNEVYPPLPISFHYHRTLMLNNFIYCIGGGSGDGKISFKAYRLNLNEAELKWEEIASMHNKRSNPGAAVFKNTLVVCGGSDTTLHVLPKNEFYEPKLNKWNHMSLLNHARRGNQSVSSGGCLYTMGGFDGKMPISSVERLNGLSQYWKFVSSMQTSRYKFAAVECDGVIYALGGWSNDWETSKSVEKYDCLVDKWAYVSEMFIERRGHCACVMRGKIFVIGGRNNKGEPVKEIECYDPSTDRWEIVAKVDDKRVNHSLVVL